jgi:hypothetical protein
VLQILLWSFSYLSLLMWHCQSTFSSILIKKKKNSMVNWQLHQQRRIEK